MIKTKSIYKTSDEQDGLRVLITRFYPRGVKKEHFDVWIRDLAPSQALLKRYKNSEIDWNDFKTGLLTELRDNVDSLSPELGDVWSLDEMMVNVKDTKPRFKVYL